MNLLKSIKVILPLLNWSISLKILFILAAVRTYSSTLKNSMMNNLMSLFEISPSKSLSIVLKASSTVKFSLFYQFLILKSISSSQSKLSSSTSGIFYTILFEMALKNVFKSINPIYFLSMNEKKPSLAGYERFITWPTFSEKSVIVMKPLWFTSNRLKKSSKLRPLCCSFTLKSFNIWSNFSSVSGAIGFKVLTCWSFIPLTRVSNIFFYPMVSKSIDFELITVCSKLEKASPLSYLTTVYNRL